MREVSYFEKNDLKNLKNIYLCLWLNGDILNYQFFINVEENTKAILYEDEKKGKFRLIKILANEH